MVCGTDIIVIIIILAFDPCCSLGRLHELFKHPGLVPASPVLPRCNPSSWFHGTDIGSAHVLSLICCPNTGNGTVDSLVYCTGSVNGTADNLVCATDIINETVDSLACGTGIVSATLDSLVYSTGIVNEL